MTRLRRLLPAAALVAACALHTRVSAPACSTNRECPNGSVCFLGECRGASAALSQVSAEVRPPADSQLGMLQRSGIDLHQSVLQDFRLESSIAVSGVVQQELADGGSAPVAAATVSFVPDTQPIPDRLQQISALADATGAFAARLAAGGWKASVIPPSPLPPGRDLLSLSSAQSGLTLRLPATQKDTVAAGTVTLNGLPVAGAQVEAVGAGGVPLSAPALTAADGSYSLLLPPSTGSYLLQAGPGVLPDGGTSAPDMPGYDALGPWSTTGTTTLALKAPPPATLSGRALDQTGAPVPGARVYAINADAGTEWTMLRSTTTDATGSWSLALRDDVWSVQAVPSADSTAPGISDPVVATASLSPVQLACPPKARAYGVVLAPSGKSVGAGYQVVATRVPDRVVTSRSAIATPTDSNGVFHLTGDRGLYRLEILPPQSSGLPRKLVQVQMTGSGAEVTLPAIQLANPVGVVGTVLGATPNAGDAPVAGATVDFFAFDSQGRSVLIGSAVTAADGSFKAILPDVPSPAVAP